MYKNNVAYYERLLKYKFVVGVDLDLVDFKNICRICMIKSEDQDNLKSCLQVEADETLGTKFNHKEEIAYILENFFGVDVNGLNLPQQLCRKCIVKIGEIYSFHILCYKSQRVLTELRKIIFNKKIKKIYGKNNVGKKSFKSKKRRKVSCDEIDTDSGSQENYEIEYLDENCQTFEEVDDAEYEFETIDDDEILNYDNAMLNEDVEMEDNDEKESSNEAVDVTKQFEETLENEIKEECSNINNVTHENETQENENDERNIDINDIDDSANKNLDVEKELKCPFCATSFSLEEERKEHLMSSHPNDTIYSCRCCCRQILQKSDDSTQKANKFTQVNSSQNICHICSIAFPNAGELKKHKLRHLLNSWKDEKETKRYSRSSKTNQTCIDQVDFDADDIKDAQDITPNCYQCPNIVCRNNNQTNVTFLGNFKDDGLKVQCLNCDCEYFVQVANNATKPETDFLSLINNQHNDSLQSNMIDSSAENRIDLIDVD